MNLKIDADEAIYVENAWMSEQSNGEGRHVVDEKCATGTPVCLECDSSTRWMQRRGVPPCATAGAMRVCQASCATDGDGHRSLVCVRVELA